MNAHRDALAAFIFGGCLALFINDVANPSVARAHTQPAIQTAIVNVRGCDVVQYLQGDKMRN